MISMVLVTPAGFEPATTGLEVKCCLLSNSVYGKAYFRCLNKILDRSV
jgi:hypothetical protein